MMRAVIDTNVYISAFVFGRLPRTILELAEEGRFELFASAAIRTEIERTLRDKFEWSENRIAEAVDPLWEVAQIIGSVKTVEASRDQTDNRILECAIAAKAGIIVTGDMDLLVLNPFRSIQILTPRQFLERLTTA